MKVYVLIHHWVDLSAYNVYGTIPFHDDFVGVYSTKEKAEAVAISLGYSLDTTSFASQDNCASIKEFDVK